MSMAEEKEPKRERAILPSLGHTTIRTLLGADSGLSPEVATSKIKLIAATHGHSAYVGATVVDEDSYQAASLRASAAAKQVRSTMSTELNTIERGRAYWHTKRETYVTVIECSVRRGKNGDMLHRAIDEEGNEIEVSERLLKSN
jgi:hypothetical protein